ncbi:MAG: hypothetical protein ACOYL8_01000 [Patescibacteria group bacterium]
MNKYESGGAFSKDNRAAKLEMDKLYIQFREIVLNNKDYALGKARDILQNLGEKDAKKIFEMFNYQEGALPDSLAAEYVKLVYSPDSLKEKMAGGKTFYEALSVIAWEIKNAHIDLNPDLVDAQVKISSKELNSEKQVKADDEA